MNEKEKNYINKLLNLEIIKQQYYTGGANNIKWNEKFNRNYLEHTKDEFIKTWITVMPKNFDIYVESYLLDTYYFWSINLVSAESNMYLDTQSDYHGDFIERVKDKYNIKSKDLLPNNIQNKLEKFYTKYSNYLSEGLCFWILIFICLILVYKKQSKYIFALLPLIISWITIMLATPICSSLRYMYQYVVLLPILFVYALTSKKCK